MAKIAKGWSRYTFDSYTALGPVDAMPFALVDLIPSIEDDQYEPQSGDTVYRMLVAVGGVAQRAGAVSLGVGTEPGWVGMDLGGNAATEATAVVLPQVVLWEIGPDTGWEDSSDQPFASGTLQVGPWSAIQYLTPLVTSTDPPPWAGVAPASYAAPLYDPAGLTDSKARRTAAFSAPTFYARGYLPAGFDSYHNEVGLRFYWSGNIRVLWYGDA
jgi:hypothetical protein